MALGTLLLSVMIPQLSLACVLGVDVSPSMECWAGHRQRRYPLGWGDGNKGFSYSWQRHGSGFRGPLRRILGEAAKTELGAPDPLPSYECPRALGANPSHQAPFHAHE